MMKDLVKKAGSLLAAIFISISFVYANSDGDTFFQIAMGALKDEEYKKAYENFFRASNEENTEAFYYLGWLYENGIGIAQDYAKAAIYYQKAAKVNDTGAIYQLAGLYKDGKGVEQDFSKALSYYSIILEANRSIYGEYDDRVMTLYTDVAKVYTIQEDYDKALTAYTKALNITERLHGKNTASSYECTKGIAEILLYKKEYEKALENYSVLLEKLEKIGSSSPADNAVIYDSFGQIYENKGDLDSAIKNYEKALVLFQAAVTIGNSFLPGAEFGAGGKGTDEYRALFSRANKILKGGAKGAGAGDGEDSEDEYSDDYNSFESDDDSSDPITTDPETESIETAGEYLNLARVYYLRNLDGDTEKALLNAQSALSLSEKFSEEPCTISSNAATIIAASYNRMNDFNQSLEFSKKAYSLNKVIWGANHPETLYSLNNIAILSWQQKKNYKDAASYFSTLFSQCSQTQGYKEALKILVDLYINWQDVPKKQQKLFAPLKSHCFNTALDIVTKVSSMSLPDSMKEQMDEVCLSFYYIAVDYYAKQDNSTKAFYYAELIKLSPIQATLRERSLMSLPELTPTDKKYITQYNENIKQFSANIIRQSLKEEKEKDVTSIATMSQKLTENRRNLEIMERDIAKRSPNYLSLKKAAACSLSEAKTWCTDGKIILEYAIFDEKYKKPFQITEEEAIKRFSLEKMAEKAFESETIGEKGTVTLNTTVPKEEISSWCFVVTKSSAYPVKIKTDFDYGTCVTNLRNLILNRNELSDEKVLEYRTALYDYLIQPTESHLPEFASEILIVPDNALSFLPFEILGNGEVIDFGEKYACTMSPSLSISMKNQRAKPKGNYKVLAFGNPIYDRFKKGNNRGIISHTQTKAEISEGTKVKDLATVDNAALYFAANGVEWKNLPGTKNELHKIQDKIFPTGVTLIEGINASEETLKSLSKNRKLSENSIVHFACHTYIDNTFPLMTSLVLSDASDARTVNTEDGYLTLPEAAALQMDADLVMISACQTDIKELTNGQSVTALAESFIFAGAKHVGIALWNVDDEAACIFFEKLYRKLQTKSFRTGDTTWAQVFRESKEELKLEKHWATPYFWSSFVLFE